MMLILHIIIALASLGFAAFVLVAPTKTKLKISYTLVAATLLSGTYLVFLSPGHLPQACASGLVYLAFAGCLLVLARKKLLATQF